MGLVINFPQNLEDRFCLALRDFNTRLPYNREKIEPEDIGNYFNPSENEGINYYIELTPREYNHFFHWLKDTQDVMGIPIKFMYVNSKREAYLGAEKNMFMNLWLKFD